MLIDRQRLVDLLVPRQAVTTDLFHERIWVELLDVEDALALPRAGKDHLRTQHRGDTRRVGYCLSPDLFVAGGVVAVVPHVVGALLAVLDTLDLATDGGLAVVAFA